jgi:hypothetical protein
VPLLLLQARRDNNVPHAGAVVMHRKLNESRMIAADTRRRRLTPIPCADDVVNTYLRTGDLPAAHITCTRPGETR